MFKMPYFSYGFQHDDAKNAIFSCVLQHMHFCVIVHMRSAQVLTGDNFQDFVKRNDKVLLQSSSIIYLKVVGSYIGI